MLKVSANGYCGTVGYLPLSSPHAKVSLGNILNRNAAWMCDWEIEWVNDICSRKTVWVLSRVERQYVSLNFQTGNGQLGKLGENLHSLTGYMRLMSVAMETLARLVASLANEWSATPLTSGWGRLG